MTVPLTRFQVHPSLRGEGDALRFQQGPLGAGGMEIKAAFGAAEAVHHPVAGDPVYGPHNCITSLHGQCLHAKTLGFVHPITGEQLRFDSELPDYFTHFLATLRRKNT